MVVARLPASLNGSYICIREALEGGLRALLDGPLGSFSVKFLGPQLPRQGFYVQASRAHTGGPLLGEVYRDSNRELLSLQALDAKARVLGWRLPKDGEESPNYTQTWEAEPSAIRQMSSELIEAIRFLGLVGPDAWLSFDEPPLTKAASEGGYLWHHSTESALFCQMGFNIRETREGASQLKIAV